jgi:hypothetical protein
MFERACNVFVDKFSDRADVEEKRRRGETSRGEARTERKGEGRGRGKGGRKEGRKEGRKRGGRNDRDE